LHPPQALPFVCTIEDYYPSERVESKMASPLTAVPRSTFAHHSKQLQTLRRAASSTALPFPQGLFKPPAAIIKPWKAVVGAQEWQTSAYHYNKQTQKTLPVAATTADKLLRDYATMIKSRGTGPSQSSAASSTARTAIAARRKSAEKMYVSGTTTKDYGDKIVINAFMFDGIEAAKEEQEKRDQARTNRAAAGGRKRPVRTASSPGARRVGGGAPRASRSPGAQRAAGAGR